MRITPEELRDKLKGTCKSPEMDTALANVAIDLAEKFDGDPNEFVLKVKDKVKADYPEHKFNANAGYTTAAAALREFINSEGPPADNEKPPEDPPPETETEKSKPKADTEFKVVKLNPKISSYGGRLYDFENKVWIKGDKPARVKMSHQIRQFLRNEQLIEVK